MTIWLGCNLSFHPGCVVIQEHLDRDAFVAALENFILSSEAKANFIRAYDTNFLMARGFAYVPHYPDPWLLFAAGEDKTVLWGRVVHELIHLGEHLTQRHGIPFTMESQEIRANVADQVAKQVYELAFARQSNQELEAYKNAFEVQKNETNKANNIIADLNNQLNAAHNQLRTAFYSGMLIGSASIIGGFLIAQRFG